MSLVFIGRNLNKPFLLFSLTLETLLHTIIHKTLGLLQGFSRSLEERKSPFGVLKNHIELPLRNISPSPSTINPRISIKGDHIYIGTPPIGEIP